MIRRKCSAAADLVYAVLVGQIASQRGEHKTAFTHFLHGARLSRDPRLAELAANVALTLDDAEAMQQTVEVWLKLSPDAIGAHQLAAYARFEANDISAANVEEATLFGVSAAGCTVASDACFRLAATPAKDRASPGADRPAYPATAGMRRREK